MADAVWGDIDIGHIVADQTGRLHTVIDRRDQWLRLESAHPVKHASLPRPPADRPVRIYVPSQEECLALLQKELGVRLLRDIEEREHTIARSARFRMDPVPADINELQNHIDMAHGVNVNDVANRGRNTKVTRKTKTEKEAALAELRQAHDEMHADPHIWPQAIAHHHAKENR